MRRLILGLVGVVMLFSTTATAEVTLYSTSFESPEFTLGPIKDQNDWWVQGDQNDASVVDAKAALGSQSLRLDIPPSPGNVYAGQPDWNYDVLGAGQSGIAVNANIWSGTGGNTTQASQYVGSTGGQQMGAVFVNIRNGTICANYWEYARDLYVSGGSASFPSEQWADLSIAVNYATQEFEVTAGGTSLGTHEFPADAPCTFFDGWSFGGIQGPRISYVDGLTITAIPEPSCSTSLLAGVVSLFAYVWRRRKQGRIEPCLTNRSG